MSKILAVILAVGLVGVARAQDIGWLVEQAPGLSAILAKSLESAPSFSARVQVQVSGKADPSPSAASGTLEFNSGRMRWEARLGDVSSAQLTPNARAAIRQINGDQFRLITRPDLKTNYLILAGAQACLESPLPVLKFSDRVRTDNQGRSYFQEKLLATTSSGSTNEIVLTRAKDMKDLPIEVRVSNSNEVFRILLSQIQMHTIPTDRFNVPAGLAKYDSVEDLVQSVLLEKMKRRMGLQ